MSSTGPRRHPGELEVLRVVVLPVVPLGEMVVRRGAVELTGGWVSRAPSSAAGLAAGRASSSQDLRGDEDTEKATQTAMATWMRVRKFARAEDGYAKLL
jgi:hypothetical protein